MTSARYDINLIRSKATALFENHGLNSRDASLVVDSMIEADITGVSTHGIRMLPSYIEKLDSGFFSKEEVTIVNSYDTYSLVNANSCIGALSAVSCIDIAIKKAVTSGIHCVFSYNCNTFGAAAYYVNRAVDNNMLGFACSNSPAAMPVANGIDPMLGTNPFAFACPTASYGPIIFDMATSIVAKSKLGVYKQKGERIPDGWALDSNGNPTNDPLEGIKGLILPMAGFKGYCIAMMIDIVAGVLSGAGYLSNVNKFYSSNNDPMNVGQFFCVINPGVVYQGDFLKEMDDYVELIRKSNPYKDMEIIIPGDRRKRNKEISLAEGIELSDETIGKLRDLIDI